MKKIGKVHIGVVHTINSCKGKVKLERNQIKIGSIISYVQMFLNIIIGLIYTPIMIRALGQSEFGLYNTVASTISSLSILSLGFGSSYIFYYTKYKANNNIDGMAKLNGLYLIVFCLIGLIAFICGLYLTNNLEIIFGNGLLLGEYIIAKKMMFILTLNLALSFPCSVYSTIISSQEKFIFLKVVGILYTVVGPLVTIPLLLNGFGSVTIVVVSFIISLIANIFYIYYVYFVLKSKFIFNSFEKGLLKSIFIFSSFIAMDIIVDQINNNIDKIILGRYFGTIEVAIYSVGATLNMYFQSFSTPVSSLFVPKIHKIVTNNINDLKHEREELTSVFIGVGRIQFIILFLILSGFIFFGKYFITNIWSSAEYAKSYYIAIILMVPSIIPLIQNIGIEVQRAKNIHQFRSVLYLFMAIFNLIISIILCKNYKSVGCAIGTMIVTIIANGIIMNIFYYKKCNIDIVMFWKEIIGLCKGTILPITFGVSTLIFVKINSIYIFVFLVLLYSIIYIVSMYKIGMNKKEKEQVKIALNKIIRR